MGDLVNPKERGTYFGRRNKIAGFATFFSFIIAGYILQQYGGDTTRQYMGYMIIFVIAMLARIVSMIFLTMMHEPEYHVVPEAYFGFLDFVKKARYNNYGIFVIYSSLMNFGVFISGPFFTAYMLRDLHLNYIEFTAIQAAAILMKNLSMPLWGMASDRFGTKRVLTIGGFLMPMVPILWSLSRNFWYLIFVQFYSGLVWAAFELAAFSFIFDITTPQKRATCVAYYNVFIGISTLVGAVIGGFILTHTPEFTLGSRFYLLFIISGILRYATSFIFLPKIREVRVVEHVPYHTLFLNVVTTLPTTGYSMFNFIHNIAQQLPGRIEKELVKDVSELIKETSKRIEEQRIVKGVSEVTREARELMKRRRLFGKVKKGGKAGDSHEKGK
jgi:MFS family permease